MDPNGNLFDAKRHGQQRNNEIILREESNLTAIGSYVNQLEERLSSFSVARRDMYVREERCAESELEMARLGENINALKVVVTNVKGERDKIKDNGASQEEGLVI